MTKPEPIPRLIVRRAQKRDAPRIAARNRAMARETEGLLLDPVRANAGVRKVLSNPARGFYLVADRAGRLVGQLLVTFEWSDWRNGCFWWIQSVYVPPAHRRRGVFRALYQHLLQQARRDPAVTGLRLYVHGANLAAQHTYRALRLKRTRYKMYEVDFAPPPAIRRKA